MGFLDRRREARRIAREEWEKADGNKDVAVANTRARLKSLPGISPIVMSLLVQLIIQLISEWWANKTKSPVDEVDELAYAGQAEDLEEIEMLDAVYPEEDDIA